MFRKTISRHTQQGARAVRRPASAIKSVRDSTRCGACGSVVRSTRAARIATWRRGVGRKHALNAGMIDILRHGSWARFEALAAAPPGGRRLVHPSYYFLLILGSASVIATPFGKKGASQRRGAGIPPSHLWHNKTSLPQSRIGYEHHFWHLSQICDSTPLRNNSPQGSAQPPKRPSYALL
jgi:hypothetical protein